MRSFFHYNLFGHPFFYVIIAIKKSHPDKIKHIFSFIQTPYPYTETNRPHFIESLTDLALVDGDPVGGGEPLVVFDVVDAVLQVAVALGQVHLQQVA